MFYFPVAPSTAPALVSAQARGTVYAFLSRDNGSIARFRSDSGTGRLIALGDADTGFERRADLVVSPNGHFLYACPAFDRSLDGYILGGEYTDDAIKARQLRPTPITVYAIGAGGALRAVQTVTLPGPMGQILFRPDGKFVYALTIEGVFLLRTAPDGRLTYRSRIPLLSGMGLVDTAGERDAWWLTFAPNGRYLYNFRGDGFVDHKENYLYRYRVSLKTGRLSESGNQWFSGDYNVDKPGLPVSRDPGAVWCFVNRTAFVHGFLSGFWVCRVDDAGRIVPEKSRIALRQVAHNGNPFEPMLARHPTLPAVIYRGDASDPYTIWRVTAPGAGAKVGAFPSAFDASWHTSLASPGGRFLYEVGGAYQKGASKRQVAAWALDETGTRARLSAPPAALPDGTGTDFVFARVLEP